MKRYENIIVVVEKTIERQYNIENGEIYARQRKLFRGGYHRSSLSTLILAKRVQAARTLSMVRNESFNNISAPAHKAKITQEWLQIDIRTFFDVEAFRGGHSISKTSQQIWKVRKDRSWRWR